MEKPITNGNLSAAMNLHRQGKLHQAEESYYKALFTEPDNVRVLYLLGTLFLQTKRVALATQMLKRAVVLDPQNFESWNNLGNCYKAMNDDINSRDCWMKALALSEKQDHFDLADVYNNLATMYVNAGNPDDGIAYAQKAISLRPDQIDANWNLSLLYLESGNYLDGFRLYEWGFKTKNRLQRDLGDKVTYWDGSANKVVAVWGEQGIGDELLFSSMIPDLLKISKKVIFECHPRMVKIFKESFPGLFVYGTRKDEYISWISDHPDLEHKIIIGDLGKYFRRGISDFPAHTGYLKAEKSRVEHYKARLAKLGTRLKVGISWTGGYFKTMKDYRSIPLLMWEPILNNNVDFISMQYTPEAYKIVAEVEESMGVKIHHWPYAVENEDYHETAALVSALDLVITVNTSLHHLAGALGKPCWTMTPHAHAWRYWSPDKEGRTIPWYPSVRQYLQKELFKWEPVILEVGSDLKRFIEEAPCE